MGRLSGRRVVGLAGHRPWLYRLVRLASRVGLSLRYRLDIQGLDQVPVAGPAVVVAKHQRWIDVPLTGVALDGAQPVYVAKHELFANPLERWVIGGLGGIPLDRQRPLRSLATFRLIRELLRRGNLVVLYPEGTFYPGMVGPGKWRLIESVLRFQPDLGVPVPFVPLGIRYFDTPARGRAVARFGPPRIGADSGDARALTELLMDDLAGLTGLPRAATGGPEREGR